jgi:two-component system chemotaxis response regulator CheB
VRRYELVVVGASWGGIHALQTVLGGLPASFPAALAVAQHRGDREPELLAALLASRCAVAVHDAQDKDELRPGHAYLAPAGYHLLIEAGWLALSTDAAVNHSRPSIDVLFESAADAYAERTIGVVLTGANQDGAVGLARIGRRGGYTIVQDPHEAERPEMPAGAIAAERPHAVLRLDRIAPLLVALADHAGEAGR